MSQSRDNIKAGIFVITGSLLALLIIFLLADFRKLMEKQQKVSVVYSIADGVKGLDKGGDVTLGDQSIGTVAAIEDVKENDRVTGIRVVAEIPQRYMIYNNAQIELVVPPLGSGTKLNIRSVGDERPYQAGTDLPGQLAGSELIKGLISEAGIRDKQRAEIARTIENLASLTQALVGDDKGNDLRQTVANLRVLTDALADQKKQQALTDILNNLRDMTHAVVGEDSGRDIRVTLTNLRVLSESLTGENGKQIKEMLANLRATSENLRVTTEALKGEDGKEIRETMANLRDVSRAIAGNDQARDIRVTLENLRDLSKAVVGDNKGADVRQMMVKLRQTSEFVESQLPVIERAMANVLIMTGQLKLTAIEVRRSPWRLMYKPKDKELETENLYDAARSFALAAGTLDAATQNLRATAATDVDRQRVDAMIQKLETVLQKVESAEGEFWHALQESRKGPAGAEDAAKPHPAPARK